MKLPSTLLIFLISNFISLNALICKKREEDLVDFNEFTDRDNSNITYLTSKNGTEVEACEYVDVIHDCYNENGELIEEEVLVDTRVHLKQYSLNGNTTVVHSSFGSYFKCINFLIQGEVKKEGLKVPIRKYVNTNDLVTETTLDIKSIKNNNLEIFCNNGKNTSVFKIDEITYPESYKSKMQFREADLIKFGVSVSVPYLPVSLPSDNYKKTVEDDAFSSSWTCTRPSENVTVPAGSGKMLSQQSLVVKKLKKYTANFVIDDDLPEEDSKRFKVFREKLRTGEVDFHQSQNGIYIDFSGDESIELINLPIREIVTKVTRIYFLSDAVPCDDLFELEASLTFERE